MYNQFNPYLCPYHNSMQACSFDGMPYCPNICPYCLNNMMYSSMSIPNKYMPRHYSNPLKLKDYGPEPFVVNINDATIENNNYRTAIWTGKYLQVTLMSINVGDDIGLEIHPNTDQFLRVERGEGLVKMGKSKDNLTFQEKVADDYAILIPAGTWHNVVNTGNTPLKLYSIYAPPHHPFGTVHQTKAIAEAEEAQGH